jgi:hypothetical protein
MPLCAAEAQIRSAASLAACAAFCGVVFSRRLANAAGL